MLNREYVHSVLAKYFPYCSNISPLQMEKFCDRVIFFQSKKHFVARGDLETVSDEVKVIVSAHAAWLLRGLPHTNLEFFSKIFIYEEDFFSEYSESYQTGEMNPEGVLLFSWKSVAKDCLQAGDGKNVAFNIFAHALSFQSRTESQVVDIFDESLLETWGMAADREYEKIESDVSGYFSSDRIRSRQDFFPVCVELLFEQSGSFLQRKPELFTKLINLLNIVPDTLR